MKKLLVLFTMLFVSFAAFSQSADVITKILDSGEMTYGQASYLVASFENEIKDDASLSEAVEVLYKKGYFPIQYNADDPIVLDDYAALLCKIFKVKGGVMCRLTKGSPRYSFKFFKSKGIIGQNSDPSLIPTGAEGLSMITNCQLVFGK